MRVDERGWRGEGEWKLSKCWRVSEGGSGARLEGE